MYVQRSIVIEQRNQESEQAVVLYEPIVKSREIYHTYPVDDLYRHDTYKGAWDICPCGPEVEIYENGNVQIIHNAWDGIE